MHPNYPIAIIRTILPPHRWKIAVLLVAVALTVGAQADFPDATYITRSQAVQTVRGLQLADIDGDGVLETVVAHDDKLGYFDLVGSSSAFTYQVIKSLPGREPGPLALQDHDGDGWVDIFFGDETGLYRLPGTAAPGVFGLQDVVLTGDFTAATLVSAVLDSLDNPYLLVHHPESRTVYRCRRDAADGTWQNSTLLTELTGRELQAADLDNDGFSDLLFVQETADAAVVVGLRNDGAANFATSTTLLTAPARPGRLAAADLDADGRTDLLVTADDAAGSLYRSLQAADGSFSTPQAIYHAGRPIRQLGAARLDDDFRTDWYLTTGDRYAETLRWFPNSGDGTADTSFVIDASMPPGTQLRVDDFYSNSRNELITFSPAARSVVWYSGSGIFDNGFSRQRLMEETELDWIYDAVPGDFNNDGLQDVLLCTYQNDRLAFYPAIDSFGHYGAGQDIAHPYMQLRNVNAGDLNGDGYDDVVFNHYTNAYYIAAYCLATGPNGTFGPAQNLAVADYQKLMDWDEDGDVDVLYVNNNIAEQVGWIENLGDGTFAEDEAFFYENADIQETVFEDVDGDGLRDVIYRYGSSVAFRTQLPQGGYSSRTLIAGNTGRMQGARRLGDDTHPTVLISSSSGNTQSYTYDPIDNSYGFVAEQPGVLRYPTWLDFDFDGDEDLVGLQGAIYGNAGWLENIDGQLLTVPVQNISHPYNYSTSIGYWQDTDNDQDYDLIYGCPGCDDLSYLRNEFNGPLRVRTQVLPTIEDCRVRLEVKGERGTPPYTYAVNDGSFSTDTTYNVAANSLIVVHAQDAAGMVETSDTLRMPYFDTPRPAVMLNGNEATVSVPGGTAPFLYQLDDGPTQPEAVFADLADGDYTITVYDANGCAVAVAFTVNLTAIGSASTALIRLTITPNPTEGAAVVHVAGAARGLVTVRLYDMLGRQVGEYRKPKTGDRLTIPLQLNGSSGAAWTVTVFVDDRLVGRELLIKR